MIGVIRKFKTASPAVKASMALLFANLNFKRDFLNKWTYIYENYVS